MPTTAPALFITWQMEAGMRYRGVLKLVDYEAVRKGKFDWKRVKRIHEDEVYIPEELTFPFAEAREHAI